MNRIFLLDDIFNPVNIGSYYLGSGGDWYLRDDVIKLLQIICEENNINRVITVGSSKGGSAALYYALDLECDCCIIGAPQYHIGTYLSNDSLKPILKTIMGDTSEQSIRKLNVLIKEEIEKEHNRKPKVFIHYSPQEHTYKDHIYDMVDDLYNNGFQVEEDNKYSYENHGEIAKYFPPYLLKKLDELCKCD